MLAFGSNGSIRDHNPSNTIHGATVIGTPSKLDGRCDGVRRQRMGPFIPVRVLRGLIDTALRDPAPTL